MYLSRKTLLGVMYLHLVLFCNLAFNQYIEYWWSFSSPFSSPSFSSSPSYTSISPSSSSFPFYLTMGWLILAEPGPSHSLNLSGAQVYSRNGWLVSGWVLIEYSLGTLWILAGYQTLNAGYFLDTCWLLLGYLLGTSWIPAGYFLDTRWVLIGYTMS